MTRFALIAAASAFCVLGATAGEDVSFESVDANGDGFVAESEFVTWKTADGTTSPADALVKFIEIDADASGMISEAEMAAAMADTDEAGDASDAGTDPLSSDDTMD